MDAFKFQHCMSLSFFMEISFHLEIDAADAEVVPCPDEPGRGLQGHVVRAHGLLGSAAIG